MEDNTNAGQSMSEVSNANVTNTIGNTFMTSDKSESYANSQKFTRNSSDFSTGKNQEHSQDFDTEVFKDELSEIYSQEDAETISQYANGLNLNEEQAKQFSDVAKNIQERSIAKFGMEKSNWEKSLKEDSDFGGVNFETNVGYAKIGLQKFDNNGEVGKLLSESGYGSHPAVVKFFQKVGKALNEDKVLGVGSRENFKERPLYDRLYK